MQGLCGKLQNCCGWRAPLQDTAQNVGLYMQLTNAGAAGGYITSSTVVEPSFDRVIKHTDCLVSEDSRGRRHNCK